MTKRVALVDIDGCLVQNGKLNAALVKKLQNYDEIILFSQRSKFIQTQQAKFWAADVFRDPTEILVTPDAVDQLSKALNKPIKVSTSVDRFFGSPGKYYERELKEFENKLKKELLLQGEELNLAEFQELCQSEESVLRELLGVASNIPGDDFYPRGKVEQYVSLTGALPKLLNTNDELVVDFFDDHPKNLQEIIDHPHLPIRPNCFVVQGEHMCSLADFNQKESVSEMIPKQIVIQMEVIDNLKNYKKNLAETINHSSKIGSFFNHRITAKEQIRAIDKAIQILADTDVNVNLSSKDLNILRKSPLNTILGNTLSQIEQYATQHEHQP